MAKGQPPRSNVSSFRLLFMIVRDEPPVLDGTFSAQFKDFVWQCLRKVGACVEGWVQSTGFASIPLWF